LRWYRGSTRRTSGLSRRRRAVNRDQIQVTEPR
jgi:hypothetical protein